MVMNVNAQRTVTMVTSGKKARGRVWSKPTGLTQIFQFLHRELCMDCLHNFYICIIKHLKERKTR